MCTYAGKDQVFHNWNQHLFTYGSLIPFAKTWLLALFLCKQLEIICQSQKKWLIFTN